MNQAEKKVIEKTLSSIGKYANLVSKNLQDGHMGKVVENLDEVFNQIGNMETFLKHTEPED